MTTPRVLDEDADALAADRVHRLIGVDLDEHRRRARGRAWVAARRPRPGIGRVRLRFGRETARWLVVIDAASEGHERCPDDEEGNERFHGIHLSYLLRNPPPLRTAGAEERDGDDEREGAERTDGVDDRNDGVDRTDGVDDRNDGVGVDRTDGVDDRNDGVGVDRTDGVDDRNDGVGVGAGRTDGVGVERTAGADERNDGEGSAKLGVERTAGADERNDGEGSGELGVERTAGADERNGGEGAA
ncbi:MAG: hypothetical protein KF894_11375 [Labilithrix sp.]|nr:hypothetical protein [Labilithrix sp.]